jgi:hypothetical protein
VSRLLPYSGPDFPISREGDLRLGTPEAKSEMLVQVIYRESFLGETCEGRRSKTGNRGKARMWF